MKVTSNPTISVPKKQVDSNNCKECGYAISALSFSVLSRAKV